MKVLLADDENISREMMADYLEGLLGMEVVQCVNGAEALQRFSETTFDLVLTDIRMPQMNGIELLKSIKNSERGKNTKVVLFTGFAELSTAVDAVKLGAYDYLYKPIDVNILETLIEKINHETITEKTSQGQGGEKGQKIGIRQSVEYSENENTADKLLSNGAFLTAFGESEEEDQRIGIFSGRMKDIVSLALKFHSDRNFPVLIEGESGTGKEIITKIIHHGTKRSDKPLISINCAAISPNLFESELFGYEANTFTGAHEKGMTGKLEAAGGGTVMLDEIGEMPPDMQPKLLRVIQERSLYRVGGLKKVNLDIRIIAATNRSLSELVAEGSFRKDLYYRINTGKIFLPSLKEQKESIAPLAQMFLTYYSQKRSKRFRIISSEAVDILQNHTWPGNVRELMNVIDRIVLLFNENELRKEHLGFISDGISEADAMPALDAGNFRLPETAFNLKAHELDIIRKALEKFKGNQTQAAKYLGISRGTLRNKLLL